MIMKEILCFQVLCILRIMLFKQVPAQDVLELKSLCCSLFMENSQLSLLFLIIFTFLQFLS